MDNEIITYLYSSKGFLSILIISVLYLLTFQKKHKWTFISIIFFAFILHTVLYIYNEKNMPHNNYPMIAINQSIQ
ncbi:hypothetical protein DOE63_08595 [Salmonella enterica subsp. diarizonae serovar 59:z10:-]|nr:hypothetical protein DOE63_08595 [Salmonella enterica subsp. diarizonae serovar 59:z10:-]